MQVAAAQHQVAEALADARDAEQRAAQADAAAADAQQQLAAAQHTAEGARAAAEAATANSWRDTQQARQRAEAAEAAAAEARDRLQEAEEAVDAARADAAESSGELRQVRCKFVLQLSLCLCAEQRCPYLPDEHLLLAPQHQTLFMGALQNVSERMSLLWPEAQASYGC